MAAEHLGPWEPLTVAEVVALFADAPLRWWISGGRALDLHLGRSWRSHEDTDVGVVRAQAPALLGVLADWELQVAAAGELRPWDGHPLDAERSENNVWCRREPDARWAIDVTVGDGEESVWIYRRDPRLRLPWTEAVRHTADGVPYLAPDLQLLFKAQAHRPKDDLDAEVVIPALTDAERGRLSDWLPAEHPWQRMFVGLR